MFAVVEHEEPRPLLELADQGIRRGETGRKPHIERLAHGGRHQLGPLHGGQRRPGYRATGVGLKPCHPQGQTGLPGTAHPGEGDEPVAGQKLLDAHQGPLPLEEGRALVGKGRGCGHRRALHRVA
jgi:hypothetical protein